MRQSDMSSRRPRLTHRAAGGTSPADGWRLGGADDDWGGPARRARGGRGGTLGAGPDRRGRAGPGAPGLPRRAGGGAGVAGVLARPEAPRRDLLDPDRDPVRRAGDEPDAAGRPGRG